MLLTRRILPLILLAVLVTAAAVFAARPALAAVGDYVSAQDFNLDSDNGNPSRIAWDGTYHRVVDNSDGKVYSYDSSGTYVSGQDFNLDSANALPAGITWDGTYHRVVDLTDAKVYSYNASGTYVSSADFNLDAANATPIGIAWDGTYYRVVDSGDDKVFSYNSAGTYVSGQDFNLHSDNTNINGMTWDGGHYRVLDRTDGKVYSYNSSGSHVSSADFNLDSAHSSAMGIGWDDTYIRVADSGTDKVYTYEGPGDADPAASDALTSLTQTALDQESAAYTVTVDTALAPTVYYQVRTSGGSWPDSASSVTSTATTTLEFTGLSADTDYEIRAGIDDDFSQGELTATFTTSFYIERLLLSAKGGEIYELDRETGSGDGASALLTNTGTNNDLWAMTQCGDALFALTRGTTPAAALRIIDPSDWTMTTRTLAGHGVSEEDARSMACDESGPTLYFAGQSNDIFYTLNPNTAMATRVGDSTNFGDSGDVRPNSMVVFDDTVYIGDTHGDTIHSVSTTTGAFLSEVAAWPLPSTGADNEQTHGMTTDGTTVWAATRRPAALFTWDAPNSTFTQVGSATQYGVSEGEPRALAFLKVPHTLTDVTSAASSNVHVTTATVTGTVSGADTHSRNYYLRLKTMGGTYGATIHKESTSGSSPSFGLTGLTADTDYVAEIGPNMAFPSGLSSTASFTTAASTGTPSITPDPAGSDWTVATNRQFHTANTIGVMTVTVSETGDDRTGDLTIHSTEAGLTCDTQTNSLSVDTASSFWVRFCDEGTLTLRIVDNADATNSQEYEMTIVEQANRAPSFAADTATRSVNENVAPGTDVGAAVTATDEDNDTITYSLTGSSDFTIDSGTGQISVAAQTVINYEETSSYTVTVKAADADDDSDTITVTINVGDLDDAPQFTTSPSDWTATIDTDISFTTSLPTNAHPTQNVTVSVTDGTGTLRIRGSREGLTCDIVTTSLSLASAGGTVWVRACGVGTATVSIAAGNSAVDVRDYAVTVVAVANSAPSQVTGLTADPGNNSIVLDWTEPSDGGSAITRYEYNTFQTESGPWATTGSSDAGYTVTQTSATNFPAALTNGNSYTVRVRACNTVGCGTSSASTTATPRAPSAPGAPTGFSATAEVTLGGFTQVALEWTAPAVDHDETITDYEYSSNNGNSWRSTGSTSTSYDATQTSGSNPVDFTLGTEYTFRVRAVNSTGNGTQSASDTATPYNIPSAPADLTGSGSDGAAVLSWTAANANGQTLLRYEYSSDDGTTWRTTGGTGTSYTATQTSAATPADLVNDTAYTFRVRAVNSFGTGPESNSVSVTPTDSTVPGKVTGLTGSPGDGSMTLNWTAPGDGGSDIIRYEYDAYLVSPGTWLTTGGTDTTVTVTQTTNGSYQMTNGQAFGFKVRAVNSIGTGPESDQLAATPANQPPAFATATATRSVDENEAVGTNVGAAITATDPESNTITYSITGTNTGSFTVTSTGQIQTGQVLDRENHDSYTITLNAAATGGSDDITVTITVNNVNEAPSYSQDSTTRSVPENSAGGTDVGMEVLATDPDFSDSLAYTLFNGLSRFTIGSGTGQIRVASGADLDYEGTNSYDVTVRATDNAGLFDEISVTINITNEVESASLTGLTAAALSRNTATATAALDNGDGAATTVYLRYRTPPGSGSWSSVLSEITSGASVSFDLTGLTEGSQYRAQASLDSAFPSAGRRQVDFTTTSNAAPAFDSATMTREIDENRLAGTNVGAPVTATDAEGDTLTYTLGGTDAASFDIDDATAQITVGTGTVLDYETKTSYSVTVTATDTQSAAGSTTVTIEVQDIREAGLLGRIIITVGHSGDDYGLDAGSYGTLDSGEFPGELFTDGNPRTVDEIYEDADGNWYWTYSGGTADGWIDDQEQLDEIQVTVTYEDGRDTRRFIVGGFISDRPGSRGLKLDPPLPSRDWDSKDGEDIAFDFRRHTAQTQAPVLPGAVTAPPGAVGTWNALLNMAPGGPVGAQLSITLLVFVGLTLKAGNSQQVWIGVAALVMTPALLSIMGQGDIFMASITAVTIGAGALIHRAVSTARG